MEATVQTTVERLHRAFRSGRTRPGLWRREQLRGMEAMVRENEAEILDALAGDLGKPTFEAWGTEVGFVLGEIRHAHRRLHRWMRPRRVRGSLMAQPGRARVQPEPLGVALILGAWNYPFHLVAAPLVGAVAAGCCAVLKPSEIAARTADLVARLVPRYLDPDCYAVVQGGAAEAEALLEHRFGRIFYTGNAQVARTVMTAAARHLTPVTLELGGKSPAIVDRNVDLKVAARRIAWGKWLNAGQTCVAPDYVLVHRDRREELVDAIAGWARKFYGEDPSTSPDYGRIINALHHRRLVRLLDSGRVVLGGEADEASRYIAPTILTDVDPGSPLMEEEIFGPLLPVLDVGGIDEAIDFVRARPHPLALYVFSTDAAALRRVTDLTTSGSVVTNDGLLQMAVPGLPFGGIGESGLGAYHGEHGFRAFSHMKAVLRKTTAFDLSVRYPPYDERKLKFLRRLL